MHTYLIRRLLLVIVTLFMVSLIVFAVVRLLPVDVIDAMAAEVVGGGTAGAEVFDRAALEKALGLDVPMHVQYGRWLTGIVLRGSLGDSLRSHLPVTQMIGSRIGVTFELGFLAVVMSLLISLPIGIYSAVRQDTVGDFAARSVAIVFIAVPSFWVATLVVLYPAIWWGWSPNPQLVRFREDPLGNLGIFIVPAFILAMAMAGTTMRMTRAMMLEVLRQDYIRTAWSKGLRQRAVVIGHALQNALIPVVTIVGASLPVMVGGAVIIEQIFALPGLGRLALDALQRRDYTLVSGINLVIATAVVLANLLVDLSYAFLDPRVRYR